MREHKTKMDRLLVWAHLKNGQKLGMPIRIRFHIDIRDGHIDIESLIRLEHVKLFQQLINFCLKQHILTLYYRLLYLYLYRNAKLTAI